MNRGFCNKCNALVPAAHEYRDGKVFLVKDCEKCGRTETMIASDAERYRNKRALDSGFDYRDCKLDCLNCRHTRSPGVVFVDITNRCNMNCPICINNTPSMGFLFEPPIEYFDKIFSHFSHYEPKPWMQLFGGEPTVREDLIDIVNLARSYGLRTRVVTNGIRLADEDYCRRLVESRATILIAYDGADPETYRTLRGNARYLDLKHRAIENLRKLCRSKVVFMSLIAKGFNDKTVPELLAYTHERRDLVRGIYFMPLVHTWDKKSFDLEPERITSEDVEKIVNDAYPGSRVDFIPAGFLGQLPNLRKYLRIKPLPFLGAHPNCESMYLLVSNGERYVPMAWYLKGSIIELGQALMRAEAKVAAAAESQRRSVTGKVLRGLHLQDAYLRGRALLAVGTTVLRHARLDRFLRGRGPMKLYHAAALVLRLVTGSRTRTALARHSTAESTLQIIVLPFEENAVIETERLERCPAAFAIYDPVEDRVKHVPVCAWGVHKTAAMKLVADYYRTHPREGRLAPSVRS